MRKPKTKEPTEGTVIPITKRKSGREILTQETLARIIVLRNEVAELNDHYRRVLHAARDAMNEGAEVEEGPLRFRINSITGQFDVY